jgi:hypothetical protein
MFVSFVQKIKDTHVVIAHFRMHDCTQGVHPQQNWAGIHCQNRIETPTSTDGAPARFNATVTEKGCFLLKQNDPPCESRQRKKGEAWGRGTVNGWARAVEVQGRKHGAQLVINDNTWKRGGVWQSIN